MGLFNNLVWVFKNRGMVKQGSEVLSEARGASKELRSGFQTSEHTGKLGMQLVILYNMLNPNGAHIDPELGFKLMLAVEALYQAGRVFIKIVRELKEIFLRSKARPSRAQLRPFSRSPNLNPPSRRADFPGENLNIPPAG